VGCGRIWLASQLVSLDRLSLILSL